MKKKERVNPVIGPHIRRASKQDHEVDKLVIDLVSSLTEKLTKKEMSKFIASLTKKQQKRLLTALARVART